ncbi:U6 snRNA-associated Sm-like protein LSm1 isoform X2 [Myotis daubentonii]|uniref:U6 snRNA-associated Sm-like protein LSm1 isoform X2 n=1 Tax=Myotis daubentonii TaxID=98922 RepID=UPI002872C2C9|nr:U6 snRNA-associated Sm-like protein LSm1 isoform X2 [Myotis daubentonii]
MAPPLPEDSTWYRKWVGIIWRSFRRAPAAESRGRSAGPGLGPRPRPAEAATTVGGRRCWTRGPFAALRCSLISAQHELYARHRQPHRGHRQSFFLFPEKHLVLLRDGRTLIGFLRSIDQFANLVLHQTVERIHVGKKYGDIPRGIFVVRGENVVLLGEIDLEKESDTPLQQVSIEEILEEQRVEQQTKLENEKLKVQALKDRGLSVPRADTLDEY